MTPFVTSPSRTAFSLAFACSSVAVGALVPATLAATVSLAVGIAANATPPRSPAPSMPALTTETVFDRRIAPAFMSIVLQHLCPRGAGFYVSYRPDPRRVAPAGVLLHGVNRCQDARGANTRRAFGRTLNVCGSAPTKRPSAWTGSSRVAEKVIRSPR